MSVETKSRLFGNELLYVREVLETGFRSSKGSIMMRRLEEAFAKRFGVKYAISHINGTATLHAILEGIGLKPGDEVIVPPLTMSATTLAVLQANATPVFADVDRETFQISAQSIAERITPKTKAIITVALFGLSPDMDPIMEIAKKHNCYVIEDDAQCFLGEYKNRLVGTIGDAASFSFQSSKHLASGEGGMVITNNHVLAENVRKVSSLGYAGVGASKAKITKQDIQDPNYFRHVTMGWNYRMPELCAAVALAQVENIDLLVQKRIDAGHLFSEVVQKCDWLIEQKVGLDYKHSYWTYAIVLQHPKISWYDFRNKFLEFGGHGIYATWALTYLEPMFQKRNFLNREYFMSAQQLDTYKKGLCPIAEELQPRLLQFKTNYWDISEAVEQAGILEETIQFFS
ncbi:MAG: DegT/DnrJ/EryC1/StrS family aminotransferase [Legionella sp.]|nr:DegT/DnrJ/EryC1/StrS family aminotransferase [Legionella sp.]